MLGEAVGLGVGTPTMRNRTARLPACVALLLIATLRPETASTVVPSAMPWPLTVEPTVMEAATASEGSARVLAPTAALVTVTLTVCAMV